MPLITCLCVCALCSWHTYRMRVDVVSSPVGAVALGAELWMQSFQLVDLGLFTLRRWRRQRCSDRGHHAPLHHDGSQV